MILLQATNFRIRPQSLTYVCNPTITLSSSTFLKTFTCTLWERKSIVINMHRLSTRPIKSILTTSLGSTLLLSVPCLVSLLTLRFLRHSSRSCNLSYNWILLIFNPHFFLTWSISWNPIRPLCEYSTYIHSIPHSHWRSFSGIHQLYLASLQVLHWIHLPLIFLFCTQTTHPPPHYTVQVQISH